MKLTVSKYLNARIGKPSTNAFCEFYRNPGDILEMDDVLAGTEIDGNAVWYHCKDDGCYYWSGGTNEINFQLRNVKEYDHLTQVKIIKSAAKANETKWSKLIPYYLGCGVGIINTIPQSKGLLIYVSKKQQTNQEVNLSEVLFNSVKIPIEIVESGKIKHHTYKEPDKTNIPCMQLDNDSTYQLGGTIAVHDEINSYGSRSLRLFKENDCYVMTCFHVLLNDLKSQKIFDFDSPNSSPKFADLPAKDNNAQKTQGKFPIVEGHYNAVMDFAVAKIAPDLLVNRVITNFIDGYYTYDMLDNLLGKRVKMAGSTSFCQTGLIKGINVPLQVDNNEWKFRNCIVAERISAAGDSGAPVVDEVNKLVGYVIAGDNATQTLILPFFPIFSNYKYRIEKPLK